MFKTSLQKKIVASIRYLPFFAKFLVQGPVLFIVVVFGSPLGLLCGWRWADLEESIANYTCCCRALGRRCRTVNEDAAVNFGDEMQMYIDFFFKKSKGSHV